MHNGEIMSVHLYVLSWNFEQISVKFKRARFLSWFSIGVKRPSVVLYMRSNSELIIFSKADCCTEIITEQRDCDFDVNCFRYVDWLTKAIVMEESYLSLLCNCSVISDAAGSLWDAINEDKLSEVRKFLKNAFVRYYIYSNLSTFIILFHYIAASSSA